MKKVNKLFAVGALSLAMIACTTNPITGRKSLQLANNQEIAAMALQQYRETLSKAKVITGTTGAKSVQNVGLRIKNAANNYYRGIGREGDIADYQWEFNLIDDKQINAWCLPITQSDAGLAVVLGHEISHALAGHGNERISQAMVAQGVGGIVGGVLTSGQMAQIFQQVYPIGAQVALLKYGRNQELEADEMGLYLMSMAGYDPRQAQPFWQRMEASSNGNRPPEFLSTHPNPDTRRSDLEKHMPKALEYYKASGGKI